MYKYNISVWKRGPLFSYSAMNRSFGFLSLFFILTLSSFTVCLWQCVLKYYQCRVLWKRCVKVGSNWIMIVISGLYPGAVQSGSIQSSQGSTRNRSSTNSRRKLKDINGLIIIAHHYQYRKSLFFTVLVQKLSVFLCLT